MRPLILKMSMTLDGFICGPRGEISWIFESSDAASKAWVVATIAQAGAHLMGSRTYQDMAAYWPSSTDVIARYMNEAPKVIFTRQSGSLAPGTEPTTQAIVDAVAADGPGTGRVTSAIEQSWRFPRICRGDMATELRALKAEPGKPLLAHGGASFARSLIATGLIDEYRLAIHPVALGRGQSIFSELTAQFPLELVEATSFRGGVVAHVYRPQR